MQTQVNQPSFNNLLLREFPCSTTLGSKAGINCMPDEEAADYANERLRYFINGFTSQVRAAERGTVSYHRTAPPRRASGCPSGTPNPNLQFSLTPFKRGDLDTQCRERVDRGVSQGFQNITLFFPIHYSGGNTRTNPYGSSRGPMREGWDYQYEEAQQITEAELHRCLEYIERAGLTLNFVPHLESILTMNSSGESEWRIHSSIPVNDSYYNRAYGGLISYLDNHPNLSSPSRPLRVAAAAEFDPSFVGSTRSSIDMIGRLR
jgi:hypothetical protein